MAGSLYKGKQSMGPLPLSYCSWEHEPCMSRRNISIPALFAGLVAGATLEPGTVISLDAAGVAVPFTGAETNLAIIAIGATVDGVDACPAIVTYKNTCVIEDCLIVPTLTAPQRLAMIADLASRCVHVETKSGQVLVA